MALIQADIDRLMAEAQTLIANGTITPAQLAAEVAKTQAQHPEVTNQMIASAASQASGKSFTADSVGQITGGIGMAAPTSQYGTNGQIGTRNDVSGFKRDPETGGFIKDAEGNFVKDPGTMNSDPFSYKGGEALQLDRAPSAQEMDLYKKLGANVVSDPQYGNLVTTGPGLHVGEVMRSAANIINPRNKQGMVADFQETWGVLLKVYGAGQALTMLTNMLAAQGIGNAAALAKDVATAGGTGTGVGGGFGGGALSGDALGLQQMGQAAGLSGDALNAFVNAGGMTDISSLSGLAGSGVLTGAGTAGADFGVTLAGQAGSTAGFTAAQHAAALTAAQAAGAAVGATSFTAAEIAAAKAAAAAVASGLSVTQIASAAKTAADAVKDGKTETDALKLATEAAGSGATADAAAKAKAAADAAAKGAPKGIIDKITQNGVGSLTAAELATLGTLGLTVAGAGLALTGGGGLSTTIQSQSTASMTQEERDLINLNKQLTERQLKAVDATQNFAAAMGGPVFAGLDRIGKEDAAINAAISPEMLAAQAKEQLDRARAAGANSDTLRQINTAIAQSGGAPTPEQVQRITAAADAAIAAGTGDINTQLQRGIGVIADEQANARGLRFATDTPILREGTLLARSAQDNVSNLSSSVRANQANQMLTYPIAANNSTAAISSNQQAIDQAAQQFQSDLQLKAQANRLALTGQAGTLGIGLSSAGGGNGALNALTQSRMANSTTSTTPGIGLTQVGQLASGVGGLITALNKP